MLIVEAEKELSLQSWTSLSRLSDRALVLVGPTVPEPRGLCDWPVRHPPWESVEEKMERLIGHV